MLEVSLQHVPETQSDPAAGASTDSGRATLNVIRRTASRVSNPKKLVESELWVTMHRQEILSKVYVPENDDFAPFGLEQIQHLCRYLAWDAAPSASYKSGAVGRGSLPYVFRCASFYPSARVHRTCLKDLFASISGGRNLTPFAGRKATRSL